MAEARSFNDTFSIDGLWWHPDKPDEKLSGTLNFSQEEGPHLALRGAFGGMRSMFAKEPDHCTILGTTAKGKAITLLDGFCTQRQTNSAGMMHQRYRVHLVCIGHHFLSEEDEIFDKSFCRFDRLEQWLDASPFNETWSYDPFKINLVVDKGTSGDLASFLGHTIGKTAEVSTGPSDLTAYTVTVRSYLYCQTDKPQSLGWHFAVASRLQGLGSLCTGYYLPLTNLKLRVFDSNLQEDERPQEVEIFAQMQHPESANRPKHERPLFTAPELLAANAHSIEHWFKQHDVIDSAINLFFAVTGSKQMFVNVRFLLAIQALEVFHRRTSKLIPMPKSSYKKLRQHLISTIPEDAPSAMRDKLVNLYAFANEPSLMQRLTDVIEGLNSDFGETVPGFSGPFARSIVDTRNYNTHFTPSLKKKALDGGEMYWAGRRLVLLLTYLFLKQIGIQPADFRAALQRHREFRSLFDKCGSPVD